MGALFNRPRGRAAGDIRCTINAGKGPEGIALDCAPAVRSTDRMGAQRWRLRGDDFLAGQALRAAVGPGQGGCA
jgi:hypothetical protein